MTSPSYVNTPVPSSTDNAYATHSGTSVCPGSNDIVYQLDGYQVSYNTTCGMDIVGSNALAAHADAFSHCLEYCDIRGNCSGVTYEDGTGLNCHPYSVIEGFRRNASSSLYSGVPTNGVQTMSEVGDADLCSQNVTRQTNIFGNVTYLIGCNQDLKGTTNQDAYYAPSLLGCLAYCDLSYGCLSVTFTGVPGVQYAANCYPNSDNGTASPQPGVAYAQRIKV